MTNATKPTLDEISKLIANLLAYLHPEYLLPPYNTELQKGKQYDVKTIEKYWEILTTIDWFTKKLSKYELFFNDFYPNSKKISDFEALEHHIHAYLEDMETLKNKIDVFITNLKNDLKKIATNKKEIDFALKTLRQKIFDVFGASKLRGKHRHGNNRFVDHYVVDGQVASTILETPILRERLTPQGLERMQGKITESITQGKAWWSNNAAKNYVQCYGLVNEVIRRNKAFLYDLLDIKPIH